VKIKGLALKQPKVPQPTKQNQSRESSGVKRSTRNKQPEEQ
jgi:hypothetical protein